MQPLVSAIMPTRNRRAFIPGAIACFLAQDWPNKELIIVDDGDSCRDLAQHPLIRYATAGGTIGAKRNIACQLARGEYIVHWDDDDWSGPKRISEQVRILRQSGKPATGYNYLPFAWDDGRRAWLYRGGNGYACGTSLMYLRAYWAGHRFSPIQIGEDNEFIRGLGDRIISHSLRSIVARIHGAATCGDRLRMLTEGNWTGAAGQNWQEIDYGQLAAVGYPINTGEKHGDVDTGAVSDVSHRDACADGGGSGKALDCGEPQRTAQRDSGEARRDRRRAVRQRPHVGADSEARGSNRNAGARA